MTIPFEAWDYPNPFIIEVTAEETDIDSYNHVNNSVYVRWFDECAREHSKAVGVDTDTAAELGNGMAVRESNIQYLRSAYLGDKVLVANWIVMNDGRLRATRHFQLIRESDGATLVRAKLDYVCIDIATGRPSRMPKLFQDKYCDERDAEMVD